MLRRLLLIPSVCLTIAGCSTPNKSSEAAAVTPIPMASGTPETRPADAEQVAKEIDFPLLPHPAKTPLATVRIGAEGESRYEIDQVVKEKPELVAQFYVEKLKLDSARKGLTLNLQGQTANGNYIIMDVQSSGGLSVVGARILRYPQPSK